jgi:hypothetical protein
MSTRIPLALSRFDNLGAYRIPPATGVSFHLITTVTEPLEAARDDASLS